MKTELFDYIFSENSCFTLSDGKERISCLTKALKDARIASNREPQSGIVDLKLPAPLFPDSWPSALLYLILLEQIGTCFKKVNSTIRIKETDNPIFKALRVFSDPTLEEKTCRSIEALRHSFAHSYSLCNIKTKTNMKGKEKIVENRTHIFTLIAEPNAPLITFDKSWKGDFKKKSEEYRTLINIWMLGDLAEEIYSNLKKEYFAGNLELLLGQMEEDFLHGIL